MSVNGITNTPSSASYVTNGGKSSVEPKTDSVNSNAINDVSAVYEKSDSVPSNQAKLYKPNPELVQKLKEEANSYTQKLKSMVEEMLLGQGLAYDPSKGLKGLYESLKVDPQTQAEAEKDISEDGYWGVTKTSERIFNFAMALTGGDPEKMEEMRSAFEKGFESATKTWGDALPEICQKTKDAVNSLFDEYAKKSASDNTINEEG